MKVRTKVWIDDDHDEVIFGSGREHMLEAIYRLGSINKAAKELKMSYRGLWGRIKSTENRIGTKLVARFLKNYKLLEDRIRQRADKEFNKIFGNTRTKEK